MCLPVCPVCGKAIKADEPAVRMDKGEFDLLQQFQVYDSEIIHENCLSYYII